MLKNVAVHRHTAAAASAPEMNKAIPYEYHAQSIKRRNNSDCTFLFFMGLMLLVFLTGICVIVYEIYLAQSADTTTSNRRRRPFPFGPMGALMFDMYPRGNEYSDGADYKSLYDDVNTENN